MIVNETTIQNALHWRLYQQGHRSICPNYTPAGWWECDMFSLTKSGRMIEHEIKLSVSDFRADANKYRHERHRFNPETNKFDIARPAQTKHEAIGSERGPTRFYYVVPSDLIKESDIPEWAGLIYVQDLLRFEVIRPAPQLHKKPVDPIVLEHVNGVFAYRYWTLRHATTPTTLQTILF